MTYDELYADWASRFSFGSKGELSESEAREIHSKWKALGTQASKGLL